MIKCRWIRQEIQQCCLPQPSVDSCESSRHLASGSTHAREVGTSWVGAIMLLSSCALGLKSEISKTLQCWCAILGAILPWAVHLFVEGLLYLTKHNQVVETTHRFCPTKKCVTDIKSKMNNIRNLDTMEIKEDESYPLTPSERDTLQIAGFVFIWLRDILFLDYLLMFLSIICFGNY